MRLLYGLDRVPRGVSPDDARLPGLWLGPAPLRLNTEPVPAAILADAGVDHPARVAAASAWLQSHCGDYAVPQRRFVVEYMNFVADELAGHRDQLARGLDRYDGLYAVEDWSWSALRPLPRAWVAAGATMAKLDMAFWDGDALLAICFGPPPAVLRDLGIACLVLDRTPLAASLPAPFRAFWQGETLPRSPFRRPPQTLAGRAA